MKVVLDSSVLIAAFATRGLCDAVFELCLNEHELISSEFISEEVKEKLKDKIRLPENIILDIEAFLRSHSTIYSPPELKEEVSRDPDDDNILSLAMFSESNAIVTGDKDLLVLESYKKIPILTPRDFADLMRKKV